MDDSLYDTSWVLYSLPSLSTPLYSLLTSPSSTASALDQHAKILHNALIDRQRPRYEDEEEKEKLGGLRACTWARISTSRREDARTQPTRKQKRKRDNTAGDDDNNVNLERGLMVSLVYDKATYKFAIFAAMPKPSSNKRARYSSFKSTASRKVDKESNEGIMLAKASPAAFKAFQSYLSDMFAIQEIHPLKLPPQFLQSTIARYISDLHTGLSRTTSERQLPLDLKAILGMMKISITFSAPIAPSLKMLDVEVPSESVLAAINRTDMAQDDDKTPEHPQQDNVTNNVLDVLKQSIYERTGLKLPISQDEEKKSNDSNPTDQTGNCGEPPTPPVNDETTAAADDAKKSEAEPPMRISRILTAAFALSSEGRLKLALKAAETCDGGGGNINNAQASTPESDLDSTSDTNVVRRANESLLVAALLETRRQRREDALK